MPRLPSEVPRGPLAPAFYPPLRTEFLKSFSPSPCGRWHAGCSGPGSGEERHALGLGGGRVVGKGGLRPPGRGRLRGGRGEAAPGRQRLGGGVGGSAGGGPRAP